MCLIDKINYDESTIPAIYSKSRQLPSETMNLWLRAIQDRIAPPIDTILDLGCGEGRFSIPLASTFHATVYGIDPSWKMLSIAHTRDTGFTQVRYLRGSGEHLPLRDDQTSMVFMSMVLHHLENVETTIEEIRRIVSQNGYVVIRQTTHEDIQECDFLRFFPTAQQFDLHRMPTEAEIITQFTAQGFQLISSSIVEQVFAQDYHEYYEKISLRGLSGLTVISDEEFDTGLGRLKQFCEQQPQNVKVWEQMHLFVFQQ